MRWSPSAWPKTPRRRYDHNHRVGESRPNGAYHSGHEAVAARSGAHTRRAAPSAPTHRIAPEAVTSLSRPRAPARPNMSRRWTAAVESVTENMAPSVPTQAHLCPRPPIGHAGARAGGRSRAVGACQGPPGRATLPRTEAVAVVATQGDSDPARRPLDDRRVATILVVLVGSQPARKTTPRPAALDGTYDVQFASATMPNGQPYDNAPGGRETWVIESACGANGDAWRPRRRSADPSPRRRQWCSTKSADAGRRSTRRQGRVRTPRPNTGSRCPCSNGPTDRWPGISSFGRRQAVPATSR